MRKYSIPYHCFHTFENHSCRLKSFKTLKNDIKHFCTSGDHFEFCPIIDETKQFLPFNFCNVIFPDLPCEMGTWQDLDNPSGEGDFEEPPDNCVIESYEIQLVDDAHPTTYSDVKDITFNSLKDQP